MPEQATTTPQAPAAAEPAAPTGTPTDPPAVSVPAPDADKQPPWGKPENFDAEKAWELIQNLRKEKSQPDPQLKQQVDDLLKAQEDQKKRFAEALGLTEPPKSEDDLTETVKAIQARLNASEMEATKLRIAAEHNIPAEHQDLLTETDPEKLKAQAEKVGALLAANAQAAQPPAFQPNPGQGHGGTPDAAAAEEAEYRKYYPESTPR